jgi:hypothetical protein
MATKNVFPFYQCPRYARCSVNNCPLHPAYPKLLTAEEDKDRKCGVSKNKRLSIALGFPNVLNYGGMTVKEFQAIERWNKLSPEEQEKRRNRASKLRSKSKPEELPQLNSIAVE